MNFADTFREEAADLLVDLESNLLELEENPEDSELINAVFRALHTIKGSGAMFGFDEISGFAHEVENVFEEVRNGGIHVTPLLISLTLKSRDIISKLLEGQTGLDEDIDKVLHGLNQVREAKAVLDLPDVFDATETVKSEPVEDVSTFRIRFNPHRDILHNGTNPIFLIEELYSLGDCDITTHFEQLPVLAELDPESCYTSWDIVLSTSRSEDAIRDVFVFVEDECDLEIESLVVEEEAPGKKLGEILVERGDISEEDLEATLKMQNPLGQLLVETGKVSPQKIESALVEQKHVQETRQRQVTNKRSSSIRVKSEKLDDLVDLVGELVTVQARLSQVASSVADSQLLSVAETVEQLTWELRDTAMSIRMLPIGTTFDKFKRLVRDLSQDLGKEIQLKTTGSETELDKNVLEQLNDPMIHLIRNSVDHGIELPELRKERGKPSLGTIQLSARHAGSNVIISIRDDGGGMKKDKILAKARLKGLVKDSDELSDREIFNLIFLPGFSTNEQVTSTSGRGVGMDVVKKNIEALSGTIDVFSEAGKGSEVRLQLPLTLAIIEGLLVQVKKSFYVIPLSLVEECIELPTEKSGNRIINLRGEFVPYIHLWEQFDLGVSDCPHQQIVLTHFNDTKLGIVVDRVVGEHQTVIKNLGSMFHDISEISGATILGDGTLALILDLMKLFKSSRDNTRAHNH
jgi:two-component system chemotaxis sensor kinase CheA